MPKSICKFLSLGLPALLLAGCSLEHRGDAVRLANDLNVYDTGSMDAERFARQTYPVWNRTGPYKERDLFREERYTLNRKPLVRPEPGHVPVRTSDEGYPADVRHVSDAVDLPDPSFTTQSIPVQSLAHYAKLDDAGHWLPAIPTREVSGEYLRREVNYVSSERPGTIVVDTRTRHLYLIQANGKAMRYGVGIGRQAYAWKGKGVIKYQRSWPRWTPSEAYVAGKPEMKIFSASYGGLVGGINNPLGARALYIFDNGKDTLFRVHGTPDWKSVGKEVSSGCIRMFNQDVIDLARRVRNGATIVVM